MGAWYLGLVIGGLIWRASHRGASYWGPGIGGLVWSGTFQTLMANLAAIVVMGETTER